MITDVSVWIGTHRTQPDVLVNWAVCDFFLTCLCIVGLTFNVLFVCSCVSQSEKFGNPLIYRTRRDWQEAGFSTTQVRVMAGLNLISLNFNLPESILF